MIDVFAHCVNNDSRCLMASEGYECISFSFWQWTRMRNACDFASHENSNLWSFNRFIISELWILNTSKSMLSRFVIEVIPAKILIIWSTNKYVSACPVEGRRNVRAIRMTLYKNYNTQQQRKRNVTIRRESPLDLYSLHLILTFLVCSVWRTPFHNTQQKPKTNKSLLFT